jgi:hypothetical protein
MPTGAQSERYRQVAARELRSRTLRDPIWSRALAHAFGDERAAQQLYLEARASQIAEDETECASAATVLHKIQRSNDELTLNFWQKTALLGSSMLVVLLVALVWFSYR